MAEDRRQQEKEKFYSQRRIHPRDRDKTKSLMKDEMSYLSIPHEAISVVFQDPLPHTFQDSNILIDEGCMLWFSLKRSEMNHIV